MKHSVSVGEKLIRRDCETREEAEAVVAALPPEERAIACIGTIEEARRIVAATKVSPTVIEGLVKEREDFAYAFINWAKEVAEKTDEEDKQGVPLIAEAEATFFRLFDPYTYLSVLVSMPMLHDSPEAEAVAESLKGSPMEETGWFTFEIHRANLPRDSMRITFYRIELPKNTRLYRNMLNWLNAPN